MNWQYLAGFFDGEGTICFAKYKYRKGQSRYIVCAMSQKESARLVLDEISKFLKTNLIKHRFSKDLTFEPRTGLKKSTYQIRLTLGGMATCKEFILKIEKHLIVKKEQAQKALKFINNNLEGLRLTEREEIKIINLYKKFNNNATLVGKKMGRSRQLIYKVIKKYDRNKAVVS